MRVSNATTGATEGGDVAQTQKEGRIHVPGGDVWFNVVGSGEAVPLLILHGGPGAGHDYLEPLADLSADRPVVFFDQLGSGRSAKPHDSTLWRMERFVDEVAAVREALDLDRVHLYGHSWGGWLAIEYLLTRPAGVVSLVLASTSASVPQWAHEVEQLKSTLPEATQATIRRHEAAGSFEGDEFEAAMMAFYRLYLCRLDPWPEPMMRSLNNLMGDPVSFSCYVAMQGPTEFTITGNLKDWDRTDRLGEIQVPTLLTFGRYDEFTAACARTLAQGLPQSQLRVFGKSAHMAPLEEPDEYRRTVHEFLAAVESATAPDPGGAR